MHWPILCQGLEYQLIFATLANQHWAKLNFWTLFPMLQCLILSQYCPNNVPMLQKKQLWINWLSFFFNAIITGFHHASPKFWLIDIYQSYQTLLEECSTNVWQPIFGHIYWANIGQIFDTNVPMFTQLYNVGPILGQGRFAAWVSGDSKAIT